MAFNTPSVKGQLGIAAAALLTVDVNETWTVQNITIHNGTTSTVNDVEFFIYPNGGTATSATRIDRIGSFLAGESRQISLRHNLNSQDVLAASAGTATAVNFVISYAQRTN